MLPFENDLSIVKANFRKHLRDVAAVKGLSAITINAHSNATEPMQQTSTTHGTKTRRHDLSNLKIVKRFYRACSLSINSLCRALVNLPCLLFPR